MKYTSLSIVLIVTFLCILSCTRVIEYTTNTTSSSNSSGSGNNSSGSNSNTGSGPTAPTPLPPATTPTTPSTTIQVSNIGFSISSNSPCSPSQEIFTFKNTTIGIPVAATYEWYFGDGNTIIGAGDSIVTNQYIHAGNYNVNMKVIYNGKTIADTIKKVVAFGPDVTPNPNFTYTLTNGNTYTFNSSSSVNHGSISKYVWNFDDGNIVTGNAVMQHNYQQFTVDKNYNVTLTATSNAGCAASVVNKLMVPAVYTISGGFNYYSSSPCAPGTEMFTFTQNISGAPSTAEYHWDFGDGTYDIGKTVTKQYNEAGWRRVVLSVYNNNASIYTYANPSNIKSYGPNVTPVASFDVQQDSNSPNVFSFNNTSTIPHGSIKSLTWDLGDASTSTGYNVKHTYAPQSNQDVSYTITLVVTGDSNCSSSVSKVVTVPRK